MIQSLKYCKRPSTTAIVIHVLGNLPPSATPYWIDAVSRGLALYSPPFHFIVDQRGEVHDTPRDSRAVGLYCRDSIDLCVLCKGNEPTKKQQTEINYLVEALKLDYSTIQLEVRTLICSQKT